MTRKVAVLGAGISGLSAALELRERGIDVVVLESSDRAGGAIGTHSDSASGFVAELGPHTIAGSNAAVERYLKRTGLETERLFANAAAKRRFGVRDGKVHALPGSLKEAMNSEYLPPSTALALLREPFVPRREDEIDESVSLFVKRRLGEDLLDYGIDLMINGIWAGDPNRLSMRHAFKRVWGLERDYGSLIKGGMNRAKEARGAQEKFSKELFSFAGGNQTLTDRAADLVDVKLNHHVQSVRPGEGGWKIVSKHKRRKVEHTVAAVISTIPGWAVGQVSWPFKPEFPEKLTYPALAVTTFGFRREDVMHPLDGFGMLIPKVEDRRILGALFTSTLFPGRAPDGHVTLAVFSGGLRDPEMAQMDASSREAIALGELRSLLGVHSEPVWKYESLWEKAIPQYEVGHGKFLVEMEAIERRHPGLFLGGNFRDAVSVPDLIASGEAKAARAALFLGESHR